MGETALVLGQLRRVKRNGEPSEGAGGTFGRLTCSTQPPTKSYWIASTQLSTISKKGGKRKRCKLVCEMCTAKPHCQARTYCLLSACRAHRQRLVVNRRQLIVNRQ